ncbi:MAG: [protein-PII] uridylyltransferase [Desulfobacterales bacterium]|nr:[protein-PII] uridylyltransferase [Desulfobacterales bacterium]
MAEHPSTILKQKRTDLISSFLEDNNEDFLEQHSRLFDDYFCGVFEESAVGPRMNIVKNPYAVVALGGYGRQEQCIWSDIDLLILFRDKITTEAEDLIREIVYPLWDIGLQVGYSTMTKKECLNLAKDDFEVLMSVLDSRFICGMSKVYFDFKKELMGTFANSKSEKITSWLVENNHIRHQRFGDSTYLLEPNLKDGNGGLRDYHTLLWIAGIKSDLKQPRDLEYYGYLTHDEFEALTEALYFIWNVRNRNHQIAGRKCDQIYIEYQIKLSAFYYPEVSDIHEQVERFMSKLHGHMELIKHQYQMFLAEMGYVGSKKLKKGFFRKHTPIKGLIVKKNMLNFVSLEAVLKSPELLINIFEESMRLKVHLSTEAKRVVKEMSHLVNEDFRSSPGVAKSFENILVTHVPGFTILNEMLNTDFLVRFLPEFKKIVNRVQYDEYHLYTVDKHLLRTVQTLKKFGINEDTDNYQLFHEFYKEIPDRKTMLWAALFHDIGKGEEGKSHADQGAEIVKPILKRMGYKPEFVEIVSFLIREHLFLIKVATRRDINDEMTAISCARKIKDINLLKMLYLLTVADSMATGPKAWNDWIAVLLRELFLKVMHILENGELATTEAVKAVDEKKKRILASVAKKEDIKNLEFLIENMSPRYLLYVSAEDILDHIMLFNNLGDSEFAWNISSGMDSDTRTVSICAKNSPGLFSRLSSIFTLYNLNILDAQIYTWRNNIALDIFTVTPPMDSIFEDDIWSRAKKDLLSVLSGDLDVDNRLQASMLASRKEYKHLLKRPHQVKIDNDSSSFFTIIEVFAYDFPGLLFSITNIFFRLKLDVHIAKVATKLDQVVDVFYIRDLNGEKIENSEQLSELKKTIEDVLDTNN